MKFKTNEYTYFFQQFQAIRSFGDNIYNDRINIDEAEMDQIHLLENMVEFNNKSKPRTKEGEGKSKYF